MEMNAIEIEQDGRKLYLSKMPAGDLVESTVLDYYSPATEEGYQRVLSPSRVRSFARFILEGGKSPTSVLLNYRGDNLSYENGKLTLPDDVEFYIEDGQHRREGLREAISSEPELTQYEVPVVIQNLKDEFEEAEDFVIINKMAKSVKTDLAETWLYKAIKKKGKKELLEMRARGYLPTLLRDIEWRDKAMEIAKELNGDKKSSWNEKIILPNQSRSGKFVSTKSFTDSLEPILMDNYLEGIKQATVSAVVKNYWNAIEDLCPIAFHSDDHVLHKTTGVFVMHRVFPTVSNKCIDESGKRIYTSEKFKTLLGAIGEDYMNDDFWHSDDAGRYGTNQKSFRALSNEVINALESTFEVEETGDLVV